MSDSKEVFLNLTLLLLPVFALAQAVQPCVVRQYNQKDAKTPLAGVQVEVRGAGTEVSDAQGALTLNFTTLKPGDRVTTRSINKEGYEVFNKSAMEQWTVSRDKSPFQIVLVRSEFMAKLKNSLRQSSTESYRNKYEQAARLLREAQETGRLKEEEYHRQIEELEDGYDNALRDLDNYIDRFARIDLSEVNAEEQRILEMVQQGDIDGAVKAYEELDLSGRLLQARENNRKLEEAKARIEEEQARQREEIQKLRESLDREVATLKLAGGRENFERIARMLKTVALDDTTDLEAVWTYAVFAQEQHDYSDAVRFYRICLPLCGDDYTQSNVLSNLAQTYADMGDYARAEQYSLAALEKRTVLFRQNPDAYRAELSMSQNNLGLMYYNMHNYAKAKEYSLAALEHRRVLFSQDSTTWREDLAMTILNLGIIYLCNHDYPKAEEYFLIALHHYAAQTVQDSVQYQYLQSNVHNNLGVLYIDTRDTVKATIHLSEALRLRTALYARNPNAYQEDLFYTENNFGKLCILKGEYESGESHFMAALQLGKALFDRDSVTYRKTLALIQHNLGGLNIGKEDDDMAIHYFQLAARNREILCQQNPEPYCEALAQDQEMLGRLLKKKKDYPASARWYAAALESYSRFAWHDDNKRLLTLANAEVNLGDVLKADEQYTEAKEYYQVGLEHLTLLYGRDPGTYRPALALVNSKLGDICVLSADLACAKQHFTAAARDYAVLYSSKPDRYRNDVSYVCDMLNSLAYFHANEEKDYRSALATIDAAIAARPDEPNYYDSKGEILLMKGDAKGALKMWRKVLELDPDFLQHLEANGSTSELYKGLKERGLVK